MLKTILLSAILLFSTGENAEKKYEVATSESTVTWIGRKVTGDHNGTVQLKNGNLKYEKGQLVGGSFEVDMTTIDNSDLSGEWKDKLVGHLKSDDFFGVDKYPTAKFVVTRAIPQGPNKYKVVGDMTIKGITHPIQFIANTEEQGNAIVSTAKLTIDRSKYNIRYGSGSFFDDLGDKTIYDEFDLNIKIVSNK